MAFRNTAYTVKVKLKTKTINHYNIYAIPRKIKYFLQRLHLVQLWNSTLMDKINSPIIGGVRTQDEILAKGL